MLPRSALFLLPLLLLSALSFGEDNVQKLLFLDFGNNRASGPPPMTLAEEEVPDVLCSEAIFPTGTYCDFQHALRKMQKFPNLNGTNSVVLNFPHPSLEDTFCKMSFIGARYETPARAVYNNISCDPEIADSSIPPVKMSEVTSIEMKLFGGDLVCSLKVNNRTVLNLENGKKDDHSLVGFLSFNSTCALPVVFGRPLTPQVVTVYLPDRIRERPEDD